LFWVTVVNASALNSLGAVAEQHAWAWLQTIFTGCRLAHMAGSLV